MLIVAKYYLADHSADVNQQFEDLDNQIRVLTDEISNTAKWKVSKIFSLRRRIRKVEQDRYDLMRDNGLIYHACILEL